MNPIPAIRILQPDDDYQEALKIRYQVFVKGQNVPADLEMDGRDPDCTHLLIKLNGNPVGAGRLREIDMSTIKIERMAVLESHRNRGYGRKMLDAMLEYSRKNNYSSAVLHAQQPAINFYERAGFQREGDLFYEAGIPHVAMRKSLD